MQSGLTSNGRHGQWNYIFEDMGLIMRQVPQYLIIGNGRLARHIFLFHPHWYVLIFTGAQFIRQRFYMRAKNNTKEVKRVSR
jgi:hypothetical protein